MNQEFNYYRMIVGHAATALETGDILRAHEILRAGSKGAAISEDPQQRSLEPGNHGFLPLAHER